MNEYMKYGLYGGAALALAVEAPNIKLGISKELYKCTKDRSLLTIPISHTV